MLSSLYTTMRRLAYFLSTCLHWLPKTGVNGKDTFLISINSTYLFIVVHIASGSDDSDGYNASAVAHNEWLAIETRCQRSSKIFQTPQCSKTSWNLVRSKLKLNFSTISGDSDKKCLHLVFSTKFETASKPTGFVYCELGSNSANAICGFQQNLFDYWQRMRLQSWLAHHQQQRQCCVHHCHHFLTWCPECLCSWDSFFVSQPSNQAVRVNLLTSQKDSQDCPLALKPFLAMLSSLNSIHSTGMGYS